MLAVKLFAFLGLVVTPTFAQYYDQQAEQILQGYDREVRQAIHITKQLIRQPERTLTDVQQLERLIILASGLKGLQNIGQDAKRRLAGIPVSNLRNETLKRYVKRLTFPSLEHLDKNEITDLLLVTAGAYEMGNYRNKLYKGLVQQRPEDVLQSWRQVVNETKDNFDNVGAFVKILAKLARVGGYARPSEFYYAEYDNPNMIQVFESLINEIKPLYEKVHAYIRHKLARTYGSHVVSESEGIPIHLFEKVMAFGWKKNGLLGVPHPDQECPNYDQALAKQRYTPQKLYELASEYYYKPIIPNNFWNDLVLVNHNASCTASVIPFYDEISIMRCEGADFGRFLEAHGTMTSWAYYNQQQKLPFYAQGEVCPGMADALAYTVALSASTPEYLSEKGIVPNHPYNEQLALNRQFRTGVRFLMELHMHFVHEKLLVELMNREISPRQTNCRYWELMNQYAGVIPPNGKANARDLDLSVLFYEGVDLLKHNSRRVFSEAMSYNFLVEVCKSSMEYIPNRPGFELDNCDLSDALDWALMIEKIAGPGIGQSWETVLRHSGVDGLRFDGLGINEYYRKLSDWLQTTNRNNRAPEGWNIRRNCQ